jgi:hypothetical protein
MRPANPPGGNAVAVFYLARGADDAFEAKIRRFAESYRENSAGLGHDFFVIYKGFRNSAHIELARAALEDIGHTPFVLRDEGLDLGAYFRAAMRVPHEYVAFLNTASVINARDWLLKLWRNLRQPDVGLVGATASFESQVEGPLLFPNAHVRSNAFMMERTGFLASRGDNALKTKADAYALEHGANSITAQCLKARKTALIVGKDGRGYPPYLWPVSGTFRQGRQENLLVRDGQTDAFAIAPHAFKRQLFNLAWGDGAPIEAFKLWDPPPRLDRQHDLDRADAQMVPVSREFADIVPGAKAKANRAE